MMARMVEKGWMRERNASGLKACAFNERRSKDDESEVAAVSLITEITRPDYSRHAFNQYPPRRPRFLPR